MKKLLVLLVAVLMALSLVGCSSGSNDTPAADTPATKTLRFNVGFDPDSFDPQECNTMEPAIILDQMYDFLYRETETGDFVPSLATGYTTNEDGTVYTFTLRDGITFEDGTPITANDVKFSWTRALDPANAFEYAYQLYYIKNAEAFNAGEATADDLGLEVVDEKTLVVTLERPTAYFVSLTGFITYGIVSEAYANSVEKYGADASTALASGPYRVAEWNKGQYVKFEKNQNYWDKDSVNLDELVIYCVSESSTEITMYETDQLDMTYMSMTSADTLRLKDQLKYWQTLNTRYVMVNAEWDDVLSNPTVRQALMAALDLDTLAETVVLNCEAAEGYIPNGMAAVDNPSQLFRKEAFLKTSGDPETAKALLAEAGYPNGEGFPTNYQLVYTTNDANKALAEAIVYMWKDVLNIDVVAQNLEGTVRRDKKNAGDYQFSLDGWTTDYLDPYSFLEIFTTGNAYNQSKYSNADYDALVAVAANSLDQAEREVAMEAAEKLLIVDEMACLPLYNSIKAYLVKDSISGVVLSKMGIADFKWADVK